MIHMNMNTYIYIYMNIYIYIYIYIYSLSDVYVPDDLPWFAARAGKQVIEADMHECMTSDSPF